MGQTITLRLKLHRPTAAKRTLYADLTRRTTAFANNLVAAGRPRELTSRTAAPHLPDRIPSAVINQALRDVAAHKHVKGFRVLPPAFNNQNLKLAKAGEFWTAAFPTHSGQVRVPLAVTERQAALLECLEKGVQQGVAKLCSKRQRWYLALSITVPAAPCAGTMVAGIDMGLRNLAVVNCEGQTLFFKQAGRELVPRPWRWHDPHGGPQRHPAASEAEPPGSRPLSP